jgi:hypothetical protein
MTDTNQDSTQSYKDLRLEAEKSFRDRRELPIGRSGAGRRARKHHLTSEELAEMQLEGVAPNPFRRKCGLYFGQFEALRTLGIDQWHTLRSVLTAVEGVLSAIPKKDSSGRMSNAWDMSLERRSTTARSDGHRQSIEGKISQNFRLLQRMATEGSRDCHPYGEKLRQLCMCIDIRFKPLEGSIDPSMGTWEYRLSTQFATPDDVVAIYVGAPRKKRKKIEAEKIDVQVEVVDMVEESETVSIEDGDQS